MKIYSLAIRSMVDMSQSIEGSKNEMTKLCNNDMTKNCSNEMTKHCNNDMTKNCSDEMTKHCSNQTVQYSTTLRTICDNAESEWQFYLDWNISHLSIEHHQLLYLHNSLNQQLLL